MSTEVEQLKTLANRRTALLAKHTGELAELDKQLEAIRQSQIAALKKQAADLGINIKVLSKGERKAVSCRLCREAGLPGDGHTARSHKKWLAGQSPTIKSKFKQS